MNLLAYLFTGREFWRRARSESDLGKELRLVIGVRCHGIASGGAWIYGVISYLVIERIREIGVRLALGGQKSKVFGVTLGQRLRLPSRRGAQVLAFAARLVLYRRSQSLEA